MVVEFQMFGVSKCVNIILLQGWYKGQGQGAKIPWGYHVDNSGVGMFFIKSFFFRFSWIPLVESATFQRIFLIVPKKRLVTSVEEHLVSGHP